MISADSGGQKLEDFCGLNCPFRDSTSSGMNPRELEDWQMRRRFHLFGHMLNYIAASSKDHNLSGIPQTGIELELRALYNEPNNPDRAEFQIRKFKFLSIRSRSFKKFGPEDRGCFGADAESELMAEAFRAYMQDPNAMKTTAPNTAYRIRQWVNTCQSLSHIIAFN